MGEETGTDKIIRPRDMTAGKIISLLQANPAYTFADIKGIIGESYPRKYATGAVFDYITERIVNDYVKPKIAKRDATELTQKKVAYSNEQLSLARKDELTGLPRRQLFRDLVEQVAKRTSPLKITLFDLDHFKNVNDAYGHEAGDKVLKGFATLLSTVFPSAARYGGEEFSIAESQDKNFSENLRVLQEGYRTLIDTTFPDHKERHLEIDTFSAGISVLNNFSEYEEALRRADDALYASKKTGRNRITHWSVNIPSQSVSIEAPREL